MAVKLFDAALRSEQRPDVDLENLAWFGVERALTLPAVTRRFESAEALWRALEALAVSETARLGRHGIQGYAAVGVHPDALPERAHDELWEELPWLLRDGRVLALGVLCAAPGQPAQWALLERQLRLLRDHDLPHPALVALPPRGDTRRRLAALRRLARAADACGLARGRVVVLGADWLVMEALEALGFGALLLCNPRQLSVAEVVQIAAHHDPRRLALGSGIAEGPADVLALPKLAVALSEAGHPHEDIQRMLYGNALRLFL